MVCYESVWPKSGGFEPGSTAKKPGAIRACAVGGGGAVVTNRGWDTNDILGHVDPHSLTESACAGSHTQGFPTNLCGWYFPSSGV